MACAKSTYRADRILAGTAPADEFHREFQGGGSTEAVSMNIPLALHHVGVAVPDVARASAQYVEKFGYELKSTVIHDSVQGAFVQFLRLRGDQTYLEFVAPDGPGSRLNNALEKGGGLHHLCYAVRDISAACDELRHLGLGLVRAPVSA